MQWLLKEQENAFVLFCSVLFFSRVCVAQEFYVGYCKIICCISEINTIILTLCLVIQKDKPIMDLE